MQYRVSRVLAGPILHVLWRPTITGSDNVPARGGAILASNHLSIIDSFFLPLMLDRPVTFAAKSEYFTGTRLVDRAAALYLRRTNQLAVDRSSTRAARGMLEAALDLLRRGELFGIYPEGTRSPDGKLYRGRTGVGWLALTSGLPVIPIAMIGTDHVLPPGRVTPRLGPIEVRVGKPMTFEQHGGMGAPAKARRAVADDVMRAIGELSGQEVAPIYASTRKEQLAAAKRRMARGAAGA